jgi:Domain of unknown function (DUF4359)
MKISAQKILFLAFVPTFMVFTNPGKMAYADYLARQLAEQVCKQDQLNNQLQVACQGLTPIVAQPFLAHYSQRKNFIFFSLYTTNIGKMRYSSIGIANGFVMF